MGLSVGLIVAFREMFSQAYSILGTLAAASFGAYILHPAIVVALQAGIVSLALPAFVKFGFVSVVGTVLAFWLAQLSSNEPGLWAVLGTKSTSQRVAEPSVNATPA